MTGEASQRADASPDEEPSADHKDSMDNATMMSRFAPDSRYMLVREFIQRERLFGKLNIFLKTKLR